MRTVGRNHWVVENFVGFPSPELTHSLWTNGNISLGRRETEVSVWVERVGEHCRYEALSTQVHIIRTTRNKRPGLRQADADRWHAERASVGHWRGGLCRTHTSGQLWIPPKVRQPAPVCPCVGLGRECKQKNVRQAHPMPSAVPECTGTAHARAAESKLPPDSGESCTTHALHTGKATLLISKTKILLPISLANEPREPERKTPSFGNVSPAPSPDI